MPNLEPNTADCDPPTAQSEALARQNRKKRVLSLVAEGLPMPQGRVFELARLLEEPVMDLGGVTDIIDAEPLLEANILGLLNSSPFEEYRKPLGFPEAAVLLGSERLRILVWGCALAEFAGRRLPPETMRAFWHHSILIGQLSEKIAREVAPETVERAYLGGLLHDIGRLPLLIVAHEQEKKGEKTPPCLYDEPAWERSYFNVDHGEIGRWISISGNFSPWMTEIIEHHHTPSRAAEHATLVGIVAAADRCCQTPVRPGLRRDAGVDQAAELYGELLCGSRPRRLLADHEAAQSQFLESSYLYTPFPRFGSS